MARLINHHPVSIVVPRSRTVANNRVNSEDRDNLLHLAFNVLLQINKGVFDC